MNDPAKSRQVVKPLCELCENNNVAYVVKKI